jgi:hypothetical protein
VKDEEKLLLGDLAGISTGRMRGRTNDRDDDDDYAGGHNDGSSS